VSPPSPGALPRLALTAGEPAGIGPELVTQLTAMPLAADLIAISDRDLLARAAARCGISLRIEDDDGAPRPLRTAGSLRVRHVPLKVVETPGQPDPRNAFHVLNALAQAADGCLAGDFAGMVTAPVQKSVINAAGESFTGHTEFLARRAGCEVVMMLASDTLRVALVTTHLPLAAVSAAITSDALTRTLRIVHTDLHQRFGLQAPRIAVLGLNPHAGEGGYLGREEIDIITPVIETLSGEGIDLIGPLPADTAFTPAMRTRYDAVLAMYHDQALPVLKSEAFDRTVNITLGLPFIRTSVDHGTALDLAGTGKADASSMVAAVRLAMELAARREMA
jgi:4-hydroxythreonine-4-phosphate dehydrogenase